MVQYHVNKLAYSRRAIILAFLSCIFLFIFIWQGVESMTNEVVSHKNTLVRLLLLSFLLLTTLSFAIFFWLNSVYAKMRAATEYAKTIHESVEERIRIEYENQLNARMSELSQLTENLEWEKQRYEKLNKPNSNGNVNIPIDYSMDRNRLVFVQQKGANGQTVYEYAYYEVLNTKLIIGKASFKRRLYSTQDKRDSLNRMIGVEDTYSSDKLTVYKQLELNINDIPEPYRTAIQLGSLKTETVLSLAKQWTLTTPTPAPISNEKIEVGKDSDTPIQIDLM